MTLFDGSLERQWSTFYSLTWTFSLSVTVLELWGEMWTARLFSHVSTSALKFLPGQSRPPSTILGIRKLETVGYPMVKTASFCIASFWHNTGAWRTDKRINRFSAAYTVLAKLFVARRKNLQIIQHRCKAQTWAHIQEWNKLLFMLTTVH